MKIGIRTNTLDKKGYGRWGNDTYKKLKEHGYSCSDFSMMDTNSIFYSSDESDTILLAEKKLASDASITINQVHGPWEWPPRDYTKELLKEKMDKMKTSIRATSVLGCKNWVIHPLMPFGIEDADTDKAVETRKINIECMKELLDTAKNYDVTICLENMPMHNYSLSKPDVIHDIISEINDDNFKMCLDTGHVSVFKDLNVGDEVRRIGKDIKALHVHDNKFGQDLHLMPYFGIIDWSDFSKALKEINFDGCFSLETIPPGVLPDEIFEDMCKSLFNIASEITYNL